MKAVMRLAGSIGCLLLVAGWTACRAEHARIDLSISQREASSGTMKELATAHADVEPPPGGQNPRPLAKVKAGEPLVLQFFFTNTFPHHTLKDARVRYFVARVEKINQKQVPDLTKGVVTQGSFELHFKPQGRVGARIEFKIDAPGIYLLRVHSENTDSDHEHFYAIDLQAE